jgi:hypothetical protein
MRKLVLLLISMALFQPALAKDPSCRAKARVEVVYSQYDPFIPFIAECKGSKSIYSDAVWGVEIEKITADGVEIEGKESFALLEGGKAQEKQVTDSAYVYKVDVDDMLFGELHPDRDYTLKKYSVPPSAKKLLIYYRIKYPDGSSSKETSLVEATRRK